MLYTTIPMLMQSDLIVNICAKISQTWSTNQAKIT